MITVGMNYEVLQGKEGDFETMFKKVLSVMNDLEGLESSQLYVDVNKAGSYLIISDWSSEDAFDGFIKSDRFKNVANWGKEQILAGRPKHEIYGRQSAAAAGPPAACPAHDG